MADPVVIKLIEQGPQGVPAAADVVAQVQERLDASIASASEQRALAVEAANDAERARDDTIEAAAEIVSTAVAAVRDGAPTNLNTLNELAAAIENDPAFSATIRAYVDGIVAAQDAMVYKGVIDASANPNYPAADRGWTYRVSVAGKVGGGSGKVVEVGDILICLSDATAAGNEAAVGAQWSAIQTNIDGAVTLTGAQTLTNKTLTAPVINSPTGIAKGDVGLSNVDNTADADKPVSTAQATADGLRVAKAGDTMTGPLTLPGDPTDELHAATRQYVDDLIAAQVLASNMFRKTLFCTGVKVSHTGDTLETVVATYTNLIPANLIGPKGFLVFTTLASADANNANAKNVRVKIGGVAIDNMTLASVLTGEHQKFLRSSNSMTAQVAQGANHASSMSTSGVAKANYTFDLTMPQTVELTIQNGNAADTVNIDAFTVEYVYGAP